MECFFAYDVVGFQSQEDVQHFADYVQQELGAKKLPSPSADAYDANDTGQGDQGPHQGAHQGPHQGAQRFHAFTRMVQAQAFPIGIDVEEFMRLADGKEALDAYTTTRQQSP